MERKFVIGVIGMTVILLTLGVIAAMKWPGNRAEVSGGGAQLEIKDRRYDWGEIPINAGKVEKIFEVKNAGRTVLELANFVTSCECTTVEVKTATEASPVFGMHTKSAWKGEVAAGEAAEIKVIFDPAFHGPTGKGAMTRMVKFETNDNKNREVELLLTGKVI